MKSPQEIEQTLGRVGRDWPAEASIVERVIDQIEREGVRPELPAPRRTRMKSMLALAASVAIATSLWWIFSPVDDSLYAQALRAIENARTIHKVTKVVPDENKPAQPATEAWFERDIGFRVNLPDEVRMGNQKHFWTYRKKDKLAIRSDGPNINELIDRELDLTRMLEELKQLGYERYPEGDQKVDGRSLKAYLLNKSDRIADPEFKSGKRRVVFLMDDESRIARVLYETRRDNRWVANVFTDWHYDVPIDRGLFEPNFGDDVKIVDAGAAFRQFVDLDQAIYHKERDGIIFGIHRLKRFADDGILFVSSVRATHETLKNYPLTQRRVRPGLYYVDGPARNLHTSPIGDSYFNIPVAYASYQGIEVCWWLLVADGRRRPSYVTGDGKLRLPVGFSPRGKFAMANFADDRGVIHHAMWDAVVELPDVKTPPTLNDIVHDVYADLSTLRGLPFRWLEMGVNPDKNVLEQSEPDETTAAQFSVAVAAYIEHLKGISP